MSQKNLGTTWHMPLKNGNGFSKRPFTTSTTAVSDGMRMLAEDEHTFLSAIAACNYMPDEKEICEAYVNEGHGSVLISEWVC